MNRIKGMFSGTKKKGKGNNKQVSPSEGKDEGKSQSVAAAESARVVTTNPNGGAATDDDEMPKQTTTPRADVTLPDRPAIRVPSRQRTRADEKRKPFKTLPKLTAVPLKERSALLIEKLEICERIFTFDDEASDQETKDMHTKRQTLLELVDFVGTNPSIGEIFDDDIQSRCVRMIRVNIFRSLHVQQNSFEADGDDPTFEASWPHLQLVYEFLLRFVISSQISSKDAKKHISHSFCRSLVELFDTYDPRERDYLKTTLHRIYGKFMSRRPFIRRTIRNVFFQFIYETERFNGIGELLEILGSIINGFALPLKPEHVQFLHKALIPLHKAKGLEAYHLQLQYCTAQYVFKDVSMARPVARGLIRLWPWKSAMKQMCFLNQLEDLLDQVGLDFMEALGKDTVLDILRTLSKCVTSYHFQIAERSLMLWNNESLSSPGGILMCAEAQTVMIGALLTNEGKDGDGSGNNGSSGNSSGGQSQSHWNPTVWSLSNHVLETCYRAKCASTYDDVVANFRVERAKRQELISRYDSKWKSIAMQQSD